MNNIFLRFLQLVSSDELHQSKQDEISHTAIFLLNEIALKDFEKKSHDCYASNEP